MLPKVQHNIHSLCSAGIGNFQEVEQQKVLIGQPGVEQFGDDNTWGRGGVG